MSLFGEYVKETFSKNIVEVVGGFATYFPLKDGMYIEDIYVQPEFRKEGLASKMADVISVEAKNKGFNKLYGSVKTDLKSSTESMKVLLAYGFRLESSAVNAIVLVKEI